VDDDRAARSSSEYMSSASKRMSMLSSAMTGECCWGCHRCENQDRSENSNWGQSR
jgi:hypothetical protein